MTIEEYFAELKTKDIICWGSGKRFRLAPVVNRLAAVQNQTRIFRMNASESFNSRYLILPAPFSQIYLLTTSLKFMII